MLREAVSFFLSLFPSFSGHFYIFTALLYGEGRITAIAVPKQQFRLHWL